MKNLSIGASTAEELADLIEREVDHWEDDRGDPGDLEGARALAEHLRSVGAATVAVVR